MIWPAAFAGVGVSTAQYNSLVYSNLSACPTCLEMDQFFQWDHFPVPAKIC